MPYSFPRLLGMIIATAVFSSVTEASEKRDLLFSHGACSAVFDSTQPIHRVLPWYRLDNPAASKLGIPYLGTLEHKFASPFTFSSDGKFVAIHHSIQSDAEQVTVRALATGEEVKSILWGAGSTHRFFALESFAFDGDSGRMAGLAEKFDEYELVLRRNENDPDSFDWDLTKILGAQLDDAVMVRQDLPLHARRSGVSIAHPYYVRSAVTFHGKPPSYYSFEGQFTDWESELPKAFSGQIVNRENKKILNLPRADLEFLNVVREPMNAHFRYAAILEDGQKSLRLIPFEQIEREMDRPKGSEMDSLGAEPIGPFSSALVHARPILKVVLAETSPYAVTQTVDGLHIWKASTGERADFVRGAIREFRLLRNMDVLAYTNGNGILVLYALAQQRRIAEFKNFGNFHLDSRIEERGPGRVLVTAIDGSVTEVFSEVDSDAANAAYEVLRTGVSVELPLNKSLRMVVETSRGKYLVQIHESEDDMGEKSSLRISVYSSDVSGKSVFWDYSMAGSHSHFALSPTGEHLVFTSGEVETTIVQISHLLEAKGL